MFYIRVYATIINCHPMRSMQWALDQLISAKFFEIHLTTNASIKASHSQLALRGAWSCEPPGRAENSLHESMSCQVALLLQNLRMLPSHKKKNSGDPFKGQSTKDGTVSLPDLPKVLAFQTLQATRCFCLNFSQLLYIC